MATYHQPFVDQWTTSTQEDLYYLIAGTGETDVPATPGKTSDWTNLSYITVDDNSQAAITTTTTGVYVLPYLRASNFGFSVPSTATIVGVEVDLYYAGVTVNGVYTESEMRLAWGAAAASLSTNNNAAGGSVDNNTRRTFGSTSDMWGETSATLTPAVVNSTDFGCVLKVSRPGAGTTSRSMGVDYIRMAVSYSVTEDGAVRTTRVYSEALVKQASPALVTRVYAEVLRSLDGVAPAGGVRRRPVIVVGG